MKNLFLTIFFLIFISCENKKSETESLKRELENQKILIQSQENKISELEDKTEKNKEYKIVSEKSENQNNYDINNLNLTILNLLSFKDMEIGNVEEYIISKDWVYVDKNEKELIPGLKKSLTKTIIYRNMSNDSKIRIEENKTRKRKGLFFTTKNNENFKELLKSITNNNFILKNSDYIRGQTLQTVNEILSNPQIGDTVINNSHSRLYSNNINEIIVNTDEYIVIDGIEKDRNGRYNYIAKSKFLEYKITIN